MNDNERRLFDELGEMDGVPWDDIGRINQEGYVDTDPINEDPRIFEDQFEMRSRELSRQPPNLQPVTISPNKSGAWSRNPQLGIEQPYQPDGNGFQTILKMDEWDFPWLWTISLGLSYDAALISGAGNAQFGVDGIILFGSGGVTQQFEVDWAEGVTFCLPMNAINVVARYSDFTAKNNTPADLRLRVNLSRGGSFHGIPPTRSFLIAVDTGALNAQFVLIPKFARRLRVQRGSGAIGGAWDALFTYTFFGTDGAAGNTGGFTGAEYLANFAASGVPVPASARSVRISNTTGSLEVVWLIFDLAF